MSSVNIDREKLKLISLNTQHLEELQYIGKQTFIDAFGNANTEADIQEYLEEAFSEAQLLQELQDPHVSYFFIQWKQKMLAYFKVKHGLPTAVSEEGTALEICRLYVFQEYQGQQLGQWMLDKIIQMAQDQQFDFVWLGVWSQNPGAIRLYERKGFSKIGSYTFMLGQDPQTDYIMKREL